MSSNDIEHASFDEVVDGGWDAAQVRVFLIDVANQVRALERRADEAQDMRAAALELVEQAEHLVAQVKDRADADSEATAMEAAGIIADAESRAREIEAAAAARVRAAEDEVAEVLERSRREAASIVSESQRDAAALISEAHSELGWRQIEAAANVAEERDSVRHDAAKMRELARVDAAAIVAGALEEADRVAQRVVRTVAAMPGRAEVERITAEAEELLENARAESETILRAARDAASSNGSNDLSAEVRRSISALRAVVEARAQRAEAGQFGDLRGRAYEMLADLRRTPDGDATEERTDLAGELRGLRKLIAEIEAELLGAGAEPGTFRVVLDLTGEHGDDDTEKVPVRPSRYQQRSANLPHIGERVESVSKAMRAMREQLKDSE